LHVVAVTEKLADTSGIRALTSEEVDSFHENGWVMVKGLVPKDLIEGLLERAKERMGEDGELSGQRRGANYEMLLGPAYQDPWIRSFSYSREMARVASSLVNNRPVRFFNDLFMAKLPASRDGGRTPWHQDLPYQPLDRAGCVVIWLPLVDCPAEMGTMRFLNGSHRAGLIGRFVSGDEHTDAIATYPELVDQYPMSEPIDLEVGDATIHHMQTVHYAPPNGTNSLRWVHTSARMLAETLYTGAPNSRTDNLGLVPGEPFDHQNFPLLEVPPPTTPAGE
jgi:hypothetical protein